MDDALFLDSTGPVQFMSSSKSTYTDLPYMLSWTRRTTRKKRDIGVSILKSTYISLSLINALIIMLWL